MKPLTLQQFAEIIGAKLPDDFDGGIRIGRVLTQPEYATESSVVISAGWYPHMRVVRDSLSKGALAVFCDAATKADYPQSNVIALDTPPLEAVQRFERWCGSRSPAKRIAITGSVGKTTTTGLINSVMTRYYHTLTGHSMTNSHGGILRNIQRLEPDHEYWVQEVGGVQPGYIESSACVLEPDIVVLTNIGESHLDTYYTQDNIFWDKSSLERYAKPDGVVIINFDDKILRNADYQHKVITCSIRDSQADYYARNIVSSEEGLSFDAVSRDGVCPVRLQLFGEHNVYNALFAIAVGRCAQIPEEVIVEGLASYQPQGMRQNLLHIGGYRLFVDAFNAEVKTVLGAAKTLEQYPVHGKGRKIFVAGHIDKLGPKSPEMHTALGHDLSKVDDLDIIILFAGDSQYTYQALIEDGCKHAFLMHSRDELDAWMRNNIERDDVVFFKSGQFEAALVKSIDHVFGTSLQNEQQYNEGKIAEKDGFVFRVRQDQIIELEGYNGKERELILPDDYEGAPLLRIRPAAFRMNRSLEGVRIPDSVVNIGAEAFYICPSLKHLKLPANLKIIGKNAFNYCKRLVEVRIPEGTIHIDRHAFYDCDALTKIEIPDSVGFFGEDVFGFSDHRKSKVLIICNQGSFAERYAREHGLNYTCQGR